MKKIIGLFAFVLILNGCDDGDLTIETIDFEDVTAVKCGINNIVYKIKDNEALLIEIPAESFINEPTATGIPREVVISASNRVLYRSYNGTIASDNICSTIPPSTPNVTEEWIATSGIIQITTTAVVVPNTALTSGNATKITGYNHNIIFKNITFNKPSGNQLYGTYIFGSYVTPATLLPFAFDEDVAKCASSNIVFNFSGSESFVLDFNPSLFPDSNGTQTALINATNKATYKLYSGGLNEAYFCTIPTPTTPTVVQEWTANDGVEATSGMIEVISTTFGTGFQHTIHLKKVTLKKGNSEFYLGDDYLYGSFID